jgi:HSP20 family protein
MAVIPKEPLEWLNLFRQQMDEIFRFLSTLEGREGFTEKEHAPLVDIFETERSFVVEVELPGCDRDDITLSLCCSTLVVEGTARDEVVAGAPTPASSAVPAASAGPSRSPPVRTWRG